MNQPYQIQGGNVIDIETGEILGEAFSPALITEMSQLESVLSILQEHETRLEAEKARLAAIEANVKAIIKKKEGYLAFLKDAYGPSIENFAKKQIEGQKSKTVKTPFGSVSFRTVPSKLVVTDEAEALKTLKQYNLTQAIKTTEKVLVSELNLPEIKGLIVGVTTGFDMTPERESMTIKVAP